MDAQHTTQTSMELTIDDVYTILRNEILTLRFMPGQALSENTVAQRFHISRTPVRNVFMKLNQDGLIDLQGRKGSFISRIDLQHAANMIFLRIQIERYAMQHIAQFPNALLFEYLQETLNQQKWKIQNYISDMDFFQIDTKFHQLCIDAAGRQSVWQFIQNMDVHYSRYRLLDYCAGRPSQILDTLYNEHFLLYDAMKHQRIDELEYLLAKHLYGGIVRSSELLNGKFKDYFLIDDKTSEAIQRDVRLQVNQALPARFLRSAPQE